MHNIYRDAGKEVNYESLYRNCRVHTKDVIHTIRIFPKMSSQSMRNYVRTRALYNKTRRKNSPKDKELRTIGKRGGLVYFNIKEYL